MNIKKFTTVCLKDGSIKDTGFCYPNMDLCINILPEPVNSKFYGSAVIYMLSGSEQEEYRVSLSSVMCTFPDIKWE